jgi:hypothetical protein
MQLNLQQTTLQQPDTTLSKGHQTEPQPCCAQPCETPKPSHTLAWQASCIQDTISTKKQTAALDPANKGLACICREKQLCCPAGPHQWGTLHQLYSLNCAPHQPVHTTNTVLTIPYQHVAYRTDPVAA